MQTRKRNVANEDDTTANTATVGYTSELATLISAALMDNFNKSQLQIIFNKIMNHLKE